MNIAVEQTRRAETEFLAAFQNGVEEWSGELPGTLSLRPVQVNARDGLREMMRAGHTYDLDLLDRLPQNRRLVAYSYRRPWYLIGRRRVGAVIASVLSPLKACLDAEVMTGGTQGSVLPPIGAEELAAHVLSLIDDRLDRQIIGVCGSTGFTDEARRVTLDRPGLTLVLVEPRADGGWRITGVCGSALPTAISLFDPEKASGKTERVRRAVGDRRSTLLYAGLNASELAADLSVSVQNVIDVFENLAERDPHLHVTRTPEACILFHTTVAEKEVQGMSVLEFLKRILGRQASPAEKIRDLRAKQVEIDDQRRTLEKALDELVTQEQQLLKDGAAATSMTAKKRLASRVAQIRQEVTLQNEKVAILAKQGQILGRQIHNLEVAQTAQPSGLPEAEDITEAAAAAETALAGLDESYEAVRTVSRAAGEQAMTPEETDILAEFEKMATQAPKDPSKVPAAEKAEEGGASSQPARDDRQRQAN